MRLVTPCLLAIALSGAAHAEDPRVAWLRQFEVDAVKFDSTIEERLKREEWTQLKVTFPSPVETKVSENNTVHAHLFRPAKPTGAGVVVLPIWKGRGLDLEFMIAQRLAKTGLSVLVMELPYQFDRAPEGHRSGDMTVSSDLERTGEAMVQGVKDVKRCAQWLTEHEQCDAKRLGIMGTSLGGHVAALVWATDRKFKAGATVLAGGNVHELFWNGSNETKEIKAELEARGVTLKDLEPLMKPFDAITYASSERKAGLLMIAAKDDPVVPIANVRALRDAFGQPRLVTYPGTHYTVALRIADILDDLSAHFATELAGK
ncbi:MAG: prolyl oligopeptidase family serine peptidase [Planctomycetota bacterium]